MQSLDEILSRVTALLEAYNKYKNLLTPNIEGLGGENQTLQTSQASTQSVRGSTVFSQQQTSAPGSAQPNYQSGLRMPDRSTSLTNSANNLSVKEAAIALQLRYRPDLGVPEQFPNLMGYIGQGFTQSGQAGAHADNLIKTTNPQIRKLLNGTAPALFSSSPEKSSGSYINQTNPSLRYTQANGSISGSDYLAFGAPVGTPSYYSNPANSYPPMNLVQRGEIKEVDGKLVIPSDRVLTYFNSWTDYNHDNFGDVQRGLSPRGQDLFKLAIMDTQMEKLIQGAGGQNQPLQLQQMRDVLAKRLETADRLPQLSQKFNLDIPAGSYPIFANGRAAADTGYSEYMPSAALLRKTGDVLTYQPWPQFLVGYVSPDGIEHRLNDGGAVMLDKAGNVQKLSQEEYAVAQGTRQNDRDSSISISNLGFAEWHIQPNVPPDSGPASPGSWINLHPADFDVKRLHAANEYLNGTLNLPLGTIGIFKTGSRDTLIGYINTAGQVLFDQPVTLQVEPPLTSAQMDEARKALLNPANADATLSALS